MIKKAMKEIEELFNSEITDYRLAKDSGVALSMIQNYRNGSRKVENMTLKTAEKLIKYMEELKMKNYDKLMVVVNELVLEEGATVSYWKESDPNDITCCYSVEELKAHLGYMNEEDYEELAFQVDFEDEDKSYMFGIEDYERVINQHEFTLNCLRNK